MHRVALILLLALSACAYTDPCQDFDVHGVFEYETALTVSRIEFKPDGSFRWVRAGITPSRTEGTWQREGNILHLKSPRKLPDLEIRYAFGDCILCEMGWADEEEERDLAPIDGYTRMTSPPKAAPKAAPGPAPSAEEKS